MKGLRKLIGVFIAVFISLPILFGIITAVGATNALISPEFLSDIPRDIVKNLPETIDELYLELKKVDLNETELTDDERIWIKAILNAKTTPKSLIEKTGLSLWLKNELSVSLKHIGDILKGEAEPETVKLNLKKLKETLTSTAMINYFKELIELLPECSNAQIEDWKNIKMKVTAIDSLPACKPANIEITDNMILNFLSIIVEDMPDSVDIFQIKGRLPYGVDVAKFIISITYLLFLIPVVFIIIGSAIGASSKRNFFKWSGYTTISGGLLTLGFASFISNIIPLWGFALNFDNRDIIISENFENFLFKKATVFSDIFLDKIFTPISELAGTVAIIGLLLIGISYLIDQKETEK